MKATARELGVTKVLVDQTKEYFKIDKQLIPLRDKRTKAKAEIKKLEASQDALKAAGKSLNFGDAKKVANLKKGIAGLDTKIKEKSTAASYGRGALAYQYLLSQQRGNTSQFLHDVFGAEHVLNTASMEKGSFNDAIFTSLEGTNIPTNPHVPDAIQEHVMNAWGIKDPDNTIVVVKNPKGQHTSLHSEIIGKTGSSSTGRAIFGLWSDQGLTKADLTNKDYMKHVFKTRGLSGTMKDNYLKVRSAILEKGSNAKVTDIQRNDYDAAQAIIDKTPAPKWDEGRQLWVIGGSHTSKVKELGGVNTVHTIDLDGNVNAVLSDEHDMFGIKPIGGKNLVTVYPPIQLNLFENKGGDIQWGGSPKQQEFTHITEGAGERLAASQGIPLPDKQSKGATDTKTVRQQALAVLQAKGTKNMGDYTDVAGNLAGLSMLFGDTEDN